MFVKFYKLILLLLLVAMVTAMPEAFNNDRRFPGPHKPYQRTGYGGGGPPHGGKFGPGRGSLGGGSSSQSQSQAQSQSGSNSGFGGSNSFASASASSSSNSGGRF